MIPMHPSQIGGAKVMRTFRLGDRQMYHGAMLTGDEVRAMAHNNRNALIEKGFLMVWPKEVGMIPGDGVSAPIIAPSAPPPVSLPAASAERHVSARGFGKWDVIEGRKVNDKPLTREEAHKLAGLPPPSGSGTN
jgi:hypothetical protein